MSLRLLFGAALVLISASRVESIRCNEGVNATILGIPLYYWTVTECPANVGNSRCFTQEIRVKKQGPVSFRYGGCISTAYSSIFTCEQLFGSGSKLDPSVLLNLLSGSDDFVNRMTEEFRKNAIQHGKLLLSSGKGMEEFVEGVFTFYEVVGLNMTEARNLKQPLTKILTVVFEPLAGGQFSRERAIRLEQADTEFVNAIGNLDTKDPKISDNIYLFLENLTFNPPQSLDRIKTSKAYKVAIENLPGLYKSMMPTAELSHWVDVAFEMLGKTNVRDVEKTVSDIIKIFKDNVKVSDDVSKFLDTLPPMVNSFAIKHLWSDVILQWGTDVMKAYSVQNSVTTTLSDSMNDFLKAFNVSSPAIGDMLSWFPGFFYRFFPAKKADIDRAYSDVTKDLKSFSFQDMARSKHLKRTNMSEFLLSFVRSVKPGMQPLDETLIINFSKIFYDAMTSEYEAKLDAFFLSLISGFKTFPQINIGKIVTDMVTKLHGDPPPEAKPMLDNLQNVVNAMMSQDFNGAVEALNKMADVYKETFPDSEFPMITKNYLKAVKLMVEGASTRPDDCYRHLGSDWYNMANDNFTRCIQAYQRKIRMKSLDILKLSDATDVDMLFAVFKAAGFDSDQYLKTLDKNSGLATYVKLFRALDPNDVKELLQDYSTWLANLFEEDDNYQFDNFLFAINATTTKITSKLTDVIKDLRFVHSPETCRYLSCNGSLCNSHEAIDDVTLITKEALRDDNDDTKKIQLKPNATMPSSSKATGSNIFLLFAAMHAARKFNDG